MPETNWWFDGDYSDCYYALGHVSRMRFACWIETQQEEKILMADIEYLWAVDTGLETFRVAQQYEAGAYPISRYDPLGKGES